jgi:transposase
MLLFEEQQKRQEQFDTPVIRKTYSQDWKNYNLAQTNEKSRFLELLYELCSQIDDLTPAHTGRARIPLRDMIFSIVFKIYSGISGRRFISDLADAHEKGYISKIPHFNSLFNYLEIDEMYFILQSLIRESASPLRTVEIDFAVDSSGFSKGQAKVANWNTAKHRDKKVIINDWLKCHLICGVKTNIVANVEITDGRGADHPQFKPLVQRTAQDFNLNHVTADKAYLSSENFRLVADRGGMAFIPFKSNSNPNRQKKDELWKNMYYFFQLRRNEFMNFYHKRSNVETTFSMIKAKFGERLRSKTEKAQINELLCKVLCHNICCVIQSIYELEIETDFYKG